MSKKTNDKYNILLMAGQHGSGKTTECIRYAKEYIASQKKQKKDWRILVLAASLDEWSKLKPIHDINKLGNMKNKVMVVTAAMVQDIYALVRDFKNGLLIVDYPAIFNMKTVRQQIEFANIVICNRQAQVKIILTYNSLRQIPVKVAENANFIQLFELQGTDERANERLFANIDLIDLAEYAFYHKNYNHNSVTIDLENQKIKCDEDSFFFACHKLALLRIDNYNFNGVIQLGGLLTFLTKYYDKTNDNNF